MLTLSLFCVQAPPLPDCPNATFITLAYRSPARMGASNTRRTHRWTATQKRRREVSVSTCSPEHGSDRIPSPIVACSLVLLQSLRQCRSSFAVYANLVAQPRCSARTKWVTSMFPKFSNKTRGKAAEITPPPHTIKAHGKYDLQIGPHTFPGTAVYEVHYLPSSDQPSGGPEAQCMLLALQITFIQRQRLQPHNQSHPPRALQYRLTHKRRNPRPRFYRPPM